MAEGIRPGHKEFIISETKDIADGLREFTFEKGLAVEPGQYVMAWIPGASENPLSVRSGYPFKLAVKKRGGWSEAFHRKQTGDSVFVRGPYGRGFTGFIDRYDIPSSTPVIGIAGGYGSVPVLSALEYLEANGFSVLRAMLGAKTRSGLLYLEEFWEKLQEESVLAATEDGSEGRQGMVTGLFENWHELGISGEAEPYFLVCGPEKMIRAAAQEAERHTAPERILVSLERYMKCGHGICGNCEEDGLSVCQDGPVFPYSELAGNRAFGIYERTKSGRRENYDL